MAVKVGDVQGVGTFGWIETDQGAGVLPGTVTGVAAASAGTTSILVSWNYVLGATGFDVYYATSENGTYTVHSDGSNVQSNSATITGLNSNTTYYFKVKAKNATGDSASFSSIENATTDDVSTTALSTLSTTTITVVNLTGTVTFMEDAVGQLFDPRLDDQVIGLNGITYYYNDIVENNGESMVRRT